MEEIEGGEGYIEMMLIVYMYEILNILNLNKI